MKYIMNNLKPISIGLISGVVLTALIFILVPSSSSVNKITFLPNFEIQNYIPNYLTTTGVYKDEFEDIHISNLECTLDRGVCIDSPITLTSSGILVPVGTKIFNIVEKSPTRIVAKFEGSAQFHMYTIDLATKKVTFKSEDNSNNPNSVRVYELANGSEIIN